jgi:hypothetical protein
MSKIRDVLKIFLILVVFVNTLFLEIDNASASFKSAVVGPRDRIRKYDEIDFKYVDSSTEGFSCKPQGLRHLLSTTNDNLKGMGDLPAKFLAGSWLAVAGILFFPILCVGIIEGLLKSGSDDTAKSLGGSIMIIISILGASVMTWVEEQILGMDDFNLDPQNITCLALYIPMFASCIAIWAVFKYKIGGAFWPLVIITISTTLFLYKELYGLTKFLLAEKAFNSLELCGDNWTVYGSNELKGKLDDISLYKTVSKVPMSSIMEVFPTKNMFPGSYKYELHSCFREKEVGYCQKIFNNPGMLTEDIDLYARPVYKQYREFVYDGEEYGYTSCKDPRPERIGYFSTIDTTSQLYYFRGNEAANFACDRFLTESTEEYRDAYRCCIEASQKLVCIANKESETNKFYRMCDINTSTGNSSTCHINTTFRTSIGTEDDSNLSECARLEASLDEMLEAGTIQSTEQKQQIYGEVCNANGSLKENVASLGRPVAVQSTENESGIYDVKIQIKKSVYSTDKYCVETYDLCPYNFRIMGGTELTSSEFMSYYEGNVAITTNDNGEYVEDTKLAEVHAENKKNNCIFNKRENTKYCSGPCITKSVDGQDDEVHACYNKAANFCQIDRHCVVITPFFEPELEGASPYIDKACINYVGSSHNFPNYKPLIMRNVRTAKSLTAPVAECIIESFKNILLNRAGHTKCADFSEISPDDKTCESGLLYAKGQSLDDIKILGKDYVSPFKKLKRSLLAIVRIFMVLAVVLFGYNTIILQKSKLNPTEIMKLILKLMFVSYFSISNNWISPVFNGVYTMYSEVIEISMQLLDEKTTLSKYENPKYSGCFFLKDDDVLNNYSSYGDRKYVAFFDTLDCKLSRYFGFYTEAMQQPPILSIFVAGILTAGVIIILLMPVIIIFVSLVYFAIRTLYYFVVSSIVITISLFLAPIFIPMYLFSKTKSMFDTWTKTILKHIFVPMFLIMSLFLFFTIFDKYFIKDATFYGTKEPIRELYCGIICKINENDFFYISRSNYKKNEEAITYECRAEAKGEIIDISENSLICFFQAVDKVGNTGIGLIDFIIKDFKGFPSLFVQAGAIFYCFLDIIFLLLVIFIFDQFFTYVTSLTDVLFSGASIGDVGLPGLKDIISKTVNAGMQLSNKTREPAKGAANKAKNKHADRDRGEKYGAGGSAGQGKAPTGGMK